MLLKWEPSEKHLFAHLLKTAKNQQVVYIQRGEHDWQKEQWVFLGRH